MNVKSGHLKFAEKLEVFHGTTLKTIKKRGGDGGNGVQLLFSLLTTKPRVGVK